MNFFHSSFNATFHFIQIFLFELRLSNFTSLIWNAENALELAGRLASFPVKSLRKNLATSSNAYRKFSFN